MSEGLCSSQDLFRTRQSRPRAVRTSQSVTHPVNPFAGATLIVLVPPVPPCVIVTLVGEADRLKFGVTGAFTVNETLVVCVKLPEIPVIVTLTVPVVAVLLAVNVSRLVLVAGFVPNAAVTPEGTPDALSVTLPVKLLVGFIEIVLVPPAPPCVTVTLDGDGDKLKFGVVDTGQLLTRFVTFTVPMPVAAKSQPVEVPYPGP